jgi:apolipoprotein N-acyltransferase
LSVTQPTVTPVSFRVGSIAQFVAGLRGWRRAAAGFAFGCLSVLSFAPFHLWPLLAFVLPGFIWLLDGVVAEETPAGKPRWRRAGVLGWWFGFGYFLAGLYWIGFAFFVEAEKFAWLVPLGVAALPAGLAIFSALAAGVAVQYWRPGIHRIFVFAAAFFLADWLRGHILTGFPWNLWGYALAGNDAIAQTASIVGIYGLTLLTLLILASPAALADPAPQQLTRRWSFPALCASLLILCWGWGTLRLSMATADLVPETRLRIVQGNIPQAEKWKPENRQWIFDRLFQLSRSGAGSEPNARPTHLIWPETAVPVLFVLNGAILHDDVRQAFADLVPEGGSFIVGAERVDGAKRADGRYDIQRVFNSLFVLGGGAAIRDTYDKTHLVPFGEYLPFEAALTAIGIKQLTHANTGFDSGAGRPLLSTPGAPAFSPLICYEAIFPGRAVMADARPGWLLNLTNDAWFGISSGPYQHLHQARLRAIEEGLPLVRAANTGISAVIDAHGRILAALPLGEQGVLDHALPVAIAPPLFARWGETSLILMAFLIVILYSLAIRVESSNKNQA